MKKNWRCPFYFPNFFLIIPLVQHDFFEILAGNLEVFWFHLEGFSKFFSPGHWSQEPGTMDPRKAARGLNGADLEGLG